jgi:hypothetical protein
MASIQQLVIIPDSSLGMPIGGSCLPSQSKCSLKRSVRSSVDFNALLMIDDIMAASKAFYQLRHYGLPKHNYN